MKIAMALPLAPRAVILAAAFAAPLFAQWNPGVGQWGRTSPSDLRVMTWNVKDALCRTNPKNSAGNNWAACARIVAAMQPDVLILQECADNSGNGTGSNADTQAQLTTVVGMFFRGGNDTFRSGSPAITQYVQAFAPGYDLPFVHVSSLSDNFNRNIILSRYPFVDLNGDGRSIQSDIPNVAADLYAPGGNGGIRGYMSAEIDLPDGLYAGDLVLGNAHFKAGGATSDFAQRLTAAQNIAYYIDYLWNGAGGAVPDPRNRIGDSPAATSILGPNDVVITGGDLNEDETTNTRVGPVQWLASGPNVEPAGPRDGTDRNRSDMQFDQSVDLFTGNRTTFIGSNYKPDYLIWQDSLCTLRRSFVFQTASVPAGAMPSALVAFAAGGSTASGVASDHLPVIGDFVLPAPLSCNSAGVDLGFGSLGGNGTYPRYEACGSLAAGQNGQFTLSSVPPGAVAYLGVGFSAGLQDLFGGTLVPVDANPVGPFFADATGTITFSFPGGGGPLTLYSQWATVDAGAVQGVSLSNALRVDLLP